MFIGNINTIPSIVNLPGQKSGFASTNKFLFDGGAGVLRAKTQNLYRFTDAISISCWVTFGDEIFDRTGGLQNFNIVDQANAPATTFTKGYSLYVTRTANGSQLLRFQIGRNNFTPNPPASTMSQQRAQIDITTLRTNKNQVFYILATYSFDTGANTGKITLHLRGEDIQPQIDTQLNPPGGQIEYNPQTNAFCIGNTSPAGNLGFDGYIDEVAIFNAELDGNDANDIYNWNKNGNLVEWNNNTARNLIDSSNFLNFTTLQNELPFLGAATITAGVPDLYLTQGSVNSQGLSLTVSEVNGEFVATQLTKFGSTSGEYFPNKPATFTLPSWLGQDPQTCTLTVTNDMLVSPYTFSAWYRMGESAVWNPSGGVNPFFTMPNSINNDPNQELVSVDLLQSDNQRPGLPPPK